MSHHRFRRAVESHNEAEIAASLAHDVVLNSPGSSRPFRDRATVAALVSAARSLLADFRYTDELVAGNVAVLVFRARVHGNQAEGADILRLNKDGVVADLTIMLRPLSAAAAFDEAMKPYAAAVLGKAGTH
jgi:hypothetical protein